MSFRRVRGVVLRGVRRRVPAALLGLALVGAAAAAHLGDWGWESWVTDGLSLVLGATGAAWFLFAVGPRRPDWVDPDS